MVAFPTITAIAITTVDPIYRFPFTPQRLVATAMALLTIKADGVGADGDGFAFSLVSTVVEPHADPADLLTWLDRSLPVPGLVAGYALRAHILAILGRIAGAGRCRAHA